MVYPIFLRFVRPTVYWYEPDVDLVGRDLEERHVLELLLSSSVHRRLLDVRVAFDGAPNLVGAGVAIPLGRRHCGRSSKLS